MDRWQNERGWRQDRGVDLILYVTLTIFHLYRDGSRSCSLPNLIHIFVQITYLYFFLEILLV